MWMIWVMVAMAAVTGYYSTTIQSHELPVAALRSESLADSMAGYRRMVVRYLAAHPELSGPLSISNADLESVRPQWYNPSPFWANHVSADGMITIYAASLPPVKITAAIVEHSQRSVLAGEANAALAPGILYSPVFGNTLIPLPAGVPIPDGSPVWMARRTPS